MDYAAFEERLIQTCINRSMLWGVLALIAVITLVIELVYYRKTGDNSGVHLWKFVFPSTKHHKLKHTTKQQIGLDIAALVILAALGLMTVLPIWHDVSGQRYIRIEAQYKRTEASSESNLFSNGYVYAEVEGERIDLKLPTQWTEEEFPLGTYQGTVWYGKKSKVILSFTPNHQ